MAEDRVMGSMINSDDFVGFVGDVRGDAFAVNGNFGSLHSRKWYGAADG
jgi:hypothetical protein